MPKSKTEDKENVANTSRRLAEEVSQDKIQIWQDILKREFLSCENLRLFRAR